MNLKKKKPFDQRKKGDPIIYKGSVKPIPLPFGKRKGSAQPSLPDTLTLKIIASPQDWNMLHLLAENAPQFLGKLVHLFLTTPVYEQFLSREGIYLPRGRHNVARQIFMEEARSYTAAAYVIISYWEKKPLDTWPDDLKVDIREAEITLGKECIWPPETPILKPLGSKSTYYPPPKKKPPKEAINVIAIVRYLIGLKYGRRGNELGLANVLHDMEDETFRKIYLDKKKVKAAVALRDDFIKKYGDSLTIDTLYKRVPKFGWEYELE